jgi:hypothetical protein
MSPGVTEQSSGRTGGQKLYLHLNAGHSVAPVRAHDDGELFAINDDRHVGYWMAQPFPVMLVIRSSKGEVRWMEVPHSLKRPTQIAFRSERFDVMSVRNWRDRVLKRDSA